MTDKTKIKYIEPVELTAEEINFVAAGITPLWPKYLTKEEALELFGRSEEINLK